MNSVADSRTTVFHERQIQDKMCPIFRGGLSWTKSGDDHQDSRLLPRRKCGRKARARAWPRISDLSATGCYVDTINPLVDGTAVRLKILTETQVFEAPATVVYSHSHLGRGLIFGEVLGNSRNVLQNWLPVAS
jgi:hypothetical protein